MLFIQGGGGWTKWQRKAAVPPPPPLLQRRSLCPIWHAWGQLCARLWTCATAGCIFWRHSTSNTSERLWGVRATIPQTAGLSPAASLSPPEYSQDGTTVDWSQTQAAQLYLHVIAIQLLSLPPPPPHPIEEGCSSTAVVKRLCVVSLMERSPGDRRFLAPRVRQIMRPDEKKIKITCSGSAQKGLESPMTGEACKEAIKTPPKTVKNVTELIKTSFPVSQRQKSNVCTATTDRNKIKTRTFLAVNYHKVFSTLFSSNLGRNIQTHDSRSDWTLSDDI